MLLEPQSKFTLSQIEELLLDEKGWQLSPAAQKRVSQAAKYVDSVAQGDTSVYGINTGFGRLAQVKISKEDLTKLQINLLRSHASGMGDPVSPLVVRRLILLRCLSLAKGHSGVSLSLVERHLDYLRKNLTPLVPELGSVGASGDLAPLAHLGLTFIGEGSFWDGTKKRPAGEVLAEHSWKPLTIGPKEGLSLTNGTQFSLALALELVQQWNELQQWVELAAVISAEAHQATDKVFLPKIHALKAHPMQLEVAKSFAKKFKSSPHMKSHRDCDRVQDSYSFRCIPQVLGPSYQMIEWAKQMLEAEVNSVSDNPVVFPEDELVYSCGHFHAQAVSAACDMMAMALTSIGNLSERRLDQLVNPLTARHPAFLAMQPGVESGLMIVQTAAASLVAENRVLASPASVESVPTNGNQEDHVSMAPFAARKALQILGNLRRMTACELVAGVRGCVLEATRTGLSFSPFVESSLKALGDKVPALFETGDRIFAEDLEALESLMKAQVK